MLLQDREAYAQFPSFREIAAALGWRSVATARQHVQSLVTSGLLQPCQGHSRGLRLTDAGRVAAGREAPLPPTVSRGTGEVSLFSKDLKRLNALGVRRRFLKGTTLWREGDRARFLVVLEQGRVKAFQSSSEGKSQTLYVFGPGEVFGFLPLLDGGAYPVAAEALDDVDARVLSREALAAALREYPDVAAILLAALARRLREAFQRIRDLSLRGALPRVAAALQELVVSPSLGPLAIVTLPLAHREFAAKLGMTPETLSRALSHLVENGALRRLGARRFQVLDAASLARQAEPLPW